MNDDLTRFDDRVRACATEVTHHLPAIAARYSPLAVLAALTEQVGTDLRLSMESGECTVAEARAILRRTEEIVLHGHEDRGNEA